MFKKEKNVRPFEGIKIIDITHVLAGPFAAYQLALLGADVIKVEDPHECDQSREGGSDQDLADKKMGLQFMTQASNKRSITLNLKTEKGREVLKKLVKDADILVENYRAGAFAKLGLGYAEMSAINPRLIYCSMTAFGQDGPRGHMTAYDHAIQSTSGMMYTTGTKEVNPLKTGSPIIDYACGTMNAFALSAALFQRERTGKGQYIDSAMLDVALILMGSHITNYARTGKEPGPKGNRMEYASSQYYEAKDGPMMIAASNKGQHERFFTAIGRPDIAKQSSYKERREHYKEHTKIVEDIIATKTAQEWEDFLQSRHVPATRTRKIGEAIKDPQLKSRNILHTHEHLPGLTGSLTVPVMAFKFEHGGPRVETPPPGFGEHNEQVLGQLGYSAADIKAMKEEGAI
jgi:crotonobetainyl-CoA:carnitine CoA-transferase CaiB-like acyl-CoA transferase